MARRDRKAWLLVAMLILFLAAGGILFWLGEPAPAKPPSVADSARQDKPSSPTVAPREEPPEAPAPTADQAQETAKPEPSPGPVEKTSPSPHYTQVPGEKNPEAEAVKPEPKEKFRVTVSGVVVKSDGTPVPNAQIHLEARTDEDKSMGTGYGGKGSKLPGEDGAFQLEVHCDAPDITKPVKFKIRASTGMFGRFRQSGADESLEFSLSNGETLGGLRLRVPPVGSIKGRVVNDSGKPVGRIQVHAAYQLPGGGGSMSVTCNEDGTFEFAGVDPMHYVVYAGGGARRSAAEGVTVEVRADEAAAVPDLVLTATGTLVVVVNAEGFNFAGKRLRLVMFTDSGIRMDQREAERDKEGNVKFPNVPAGSLRFEIHCNGCETSERLMARLTPGEEYHYGTVALTVSR